LPGRPSAAGGRHHLRTVPVILDNAALRRLVGPVAETPHAEGVRRTLEALRARAGAPAPA
jgi:hypothetical protein